MYKLIRELPLPNGLTVRFLDATRRYFGDYHKVRVRIACDIPLAAGLFQDSASREAAFKLLGGSVQYVKDVEQQGVPTEATSEAVERIIRQFVEHSAGYLQSDGFPAKFINSELKRVSGKGRRFTPIAMHE